MRNLLLPEYRDLRRFATCTAENATPVRFAASLVTLGPTLVKLGQMLSTRPVATLLDGTAVAVKVQRPDLDRLAGCELDELDLSQEGWVVDRFRANFAGRNDDKFPAVHWSRSSQRVLTMSWAQGLRLHDLCPGQSPFGPACAAWCMRRMDTDAVAAIAGAAPS